MADTNGHSDWSWDTGASSRLVELSCERAVKNGMRVVGEGDIVSTHG